MVVRCVTIKRPHLAVTQIHHLGGQRYLIFQYQRIDLELNRWSINITDTAKEFVSGVYIFHVCSGQICNSGGAFDGVCNEVRPTESYPANDYFTLFPAANATPITSPQKIIQSPSPIQPPASAGTIGPYHDAIFPSASCMAYHSVRIYGNPESHYCKKEIIVILNLPTRTSSVYFVRGRQNLREGNPARCHSHTSRGLPLSDCMR